MATKEKFSKKDLHNLIARVNGADIPASGEYANGGPPFEKLQNRDASSNYLNWRSSTAEARAFLLIHAPQEALEIELNGKDVYWGDRLASEQRENFKQREAANRQFLWTVGISLLFGVALGAALPEHFWW